MAIDENGVVTFTPEEQAKVDEIVKERLARVKSEKPSDYEDLKEIEKEISEFFEGSTTAERKAAIKAYKAELAAEKELQELQEKAKYEGTSPELLKEIREAKKEAEEAKQKIKQIEETEQKKKADAERERQIAENYQAARKELLEKHGVDADNLEKNERFMKFIKGKSGINLIEEYESYIEIVGEAEAEAIKKVSTKEERSTSSGKSNSSDGKSYGLTDNQKMLATQSGMSYKEYADALSLIRK